MSLLLLCAALSLARADTPEQILERARAAQRVDAAVQQLRMTLVSRSGAERVRELEIRIKREGEVTSTWSRFSKPADVAGVQLVLVDHPDRADEQLLWLPALKRVNHISGGARSGAFMGSDFSFEDLEVSGAAAGTHRLLSEDDAEWVIETIPPEGSSYGRVVVHVSKSELFPLRLELFDRKGVAAKELEVLELAHVGEHAVPIRTVMRDLRKGSSTRLEVLSQDLEPDPALVADEIFTAAWMENNG